MKLRSKMGLLFIPLACIFLTMGSCSNNDNNNTMPVVKTTPLYDTLGWFIQGAEGDISGQGIKMITDPDDKTGPKIQAGRLAIRTVVAAALPKIAGDAQLAPYFPVLLAELGKNDMSGFSALLNSFTDFVQSAVSGQTGLYKGPDMRTVHNNATFARFGSAEHPTADMADFNAFIGHVGEAATEAKVPASVTGQLAALLVSTKGDVVQDPN